MELKIKVKLGEIADIESALKKIREIEKECMCKCTLVEIEIA